MQDRHFAGAVGSWMGCIHVDVDMISPAIYECRACLDVALLPSLHGNSELASGSIVRVRRKTPREVCIYAQLWSLYCCIYAQPWSIDRKRHALRDCTDDPPTHRAHRRPEAGSSYSKGRAYSSSCAGPPAARRTSKNSRHCFSVHPLGLPLSPAVACSSLFSRSADDAALSFAPGVEKSHGKTPSSHFPGLGSAPNSPFARAAVSFSNANSEAEPTAGGLVSVSVPQFIGLLGMPCPLCGRRGGPGATVGGSLNRSELAGPRGARLGGEPKFGGDRLYCGDQHMAGQAWDSWCVRVTSLDSNAASPDPYHLDDYPSKTIQDPSAHRQTGMTYMYRPDPSQGAVKTHPQGAASHPA